MQTPPASAQVVVLAVASLSIASQTWGETLSVSSNPYVALRQLEVSSISTR
jgi:hypothetical protein